MRPVVTAAEMRELDRMTIEEIGLPGAVLMETAGRAVAEAAWERSATGHVAVVCGPGNNGGDGYVAARVLREHGADAVVYLVAARDAIRGDARLHLEVYERCGGRVVDATAADALASIEGAAVVIDALFGIGGKPARGHAAAVIEAINRARWVVAADVPSGMDADTGAGDPVVRADVTVTMGMLKMGLVGAPGFVKAGDVRVADIGIPGARVRARAGLVEREDLVVPTTTAMDHKGKRGHVLVVGGSPGHRGAGRLAAWSALRAGAGLVTLAGPGPEEILAPEAVMTASCDDSGAVAALAEGKDAIVIGPGMSTEEDGAAMVQAALATGLPCVLDADALNHLARAPERLPDGTVITPHPGEAARLLGTTAAEVERDRASAARRIAATTGAVVVLKGARTIVCDPDGFVSINPTGGPALATGGTGDVLAGALGSLRGQGLAPVGAARLAVWIHGATAAMLPTRGATASDVADLLPRALADLA
jgi:NAD(P)H-hydrate epimerase